ncbi:unnamed protein product [Lactuca saligna]|uniref:Uncharacterized protein n=1 Tax=Lactuca saligna TaxID=75948 RepID=A0AA36A2V6_LACSI|nr:unnamed protein product [Lactuca saligna]
MGFIGSRFSTLVAGEQCLKIPPAYQIRLSLEYHIGLQQSFSSSKIKLRMEKTLLPTASIRVMSVVFLLRSQGGVANFGMSNEFQLFITSVVIAQCISQTVKFVGMSREDEKKAFLVAYCFEVIGIHSMCLMWIVDHNILMVLIMNFLLRFILHCWDIWMLGYLGYQIDVAVVREKRFWVRFLLICCSILIMAFIYASVFIMVSGYMRG